MTKTQLIKNLVSSTGLQRDQVERFLSALSDECRSALRAGDRFEVPGIVKVKVVKKPATQATTKMNPFTKAMIEVAAKPESVRVKASPTKSLKDDFG
jgi:DNA-binding protein HU-beta